MAQALYRKWRPRTFEEVVGQEHVVRTLRNALLAGRVRHAGHGGIIHVPVGEALAAAGGTPYSPLQLVLMAACVIWGLVGTALFFARRKG